MSDIAERPDWLDTWLRGDEVVDERGDIMQRELIRYVDELEEAYWDLLDNPPRTEDEHYSEYDIIAAYNAGQKSAGVEPVYSHAMAWLRERVSKSAAGG